MPRQEFIKRFAALQGSFGARKCGARALKPGAGLRHVRQGDHPDFKPVFCRANLLTGHFHIVLADRHSLAVPAHIHIRCHHIKHEILPRGVIASVGGINSRLRLPDACADPPAGIERLNGLKLRTRNRAVAKIEGKRAV